MMNMLNLQHADFLFCYKLRDVSLPYNNDIGMHTACCNVVDGGTVVAPKGKPTRSSRTLLRAS